MVVDLKANELVLKASDSNFLAEDTNVDGKLILTNQRVYFKPKNNESPKYDLEILPNQIQEIISFNTMKVFPNGLNIVTKEGKELKFKIGKRNSWSKALNKIY
ncbi:MAG: GRAM domain-containing protein [Thiohalospira sp.]